MQTPFHQDLDNHPSPWRILLALAGMVFFGLVIFNFIGMGLVMIFFDFDLEKTLAAFSDPTRDDTMKIPLLLLQGIISMGTFIIVPSLVMVLSGLGSPFRLFKVGKSWINQAFLAIMITFCFMIVNSIIIEWNMGITLPESFSWFDSWAREKEDELGRLTKYITSFSGHGQFMIAIVVVAIFPAIGEELLFRGLFQNLFARILANPHAAIWVTGFLFAAFHAQFFGIVPRMLLGVLFGYLYYWSGSLTYPMIAHFVNNGFMLTMVYLKDLGTISYDIESHNNSPSGWIILAFSVITTGLLILFYRHFKMEEHGRVAKSV